MDTIETADREPITHELKVWPEFFDALDNRTKPFEVRKNDRDYRVGDQLYLYEFDPKTEAVGNRYLYREVTYVLPGGTSGIEPGFVVMGIV